MQVPRIELRRGDTLIISCETRLQGSEVEQVQDRVARGLPVVVLDSGMALVGVLSRPRRRWWWPL